MSGLTAVSSLLLPVLQQRVCNGNPQHTDDVKWVWFMGVAYKIGRDFGVELPVPETTFEKLGDPEDEVGSVT